MRRRYHLNGVGMQLPGSSLAWGLEAIWLSTAFILWSSLVVSGEFLCGTIGFWSPALVVLPGLVSKCCKHGYIYYYPMKHNAK